MVEKLEKNIVSFHREAHALDNPTGQKGIVGIGNVDVPIHFPNITVEFQDLIEEMKNQSLMTTRRLEERIAT